MSKSFTLFVFSHKYSGFRWFSLQVYKRILEDIDLFPGQRTTWKMFPLPDSIPHPIYNPWKDRFVQKSFSLSGWASVRIFKKVSCSQVGFQCSNCCYPERSGVVAVVVYSQFSFQKQIFQGDLENCKLHWPPHCWCWDNIVIHCNCMSGHICSVP